MRRSTVLGTMLAIGALSLTASAYQQARGGAAAGGGQPAEKVVTVDKVKDNLYVLKGGGGNTTVFIGANGVTVVDTKLAGWGQPIMAKIKELTPKPVTQIINTHSHGDHTSGNAEFPATVDIIATETTKKNVEAWPPVYGLNNNFPNVIKDAGHGVPTKTFKDKMTVGSGADRIDLFYFGRAHTGGDAFVLFPALRVMAVGDVFPNKGIPIMDKNAGGSGVDFPGTLAKAYAGCTGADTLVTGHAQTTMTRDDLKTYGEFIKEFVQAVRDAKKAGKSADDFAAGYKVPEKYTGYPAAQAASVKNAASVIMEEAK
jgi:glyoxylase-like metal-dependent hydrolase (beta-lactamase superfamily II)